MFVRARVGIVLTLAGCGGNGDTGRGVARCERLSFADSIPIAEASGAAVLRVDGDDVILVVGDSGGGGAYVLVEASGGELVESGSLPLGDGATDDLEGIAADGERILGVTSGGWMRAWQRKGDGYQLVDGPYPVADPAAGDGMVCAGFNCGKNYEGLCTVPGASPRECAGWLAGKADGRLWCLVRDDGDSGRLRVDPARSIAVTGGGVLGGCEHDPASDALWVATNVFDGGLYRVTGWREATPAGARVERLDAPGGDFPEALAVGPGGMYRFSDLGVAPSPAERWRCR